MKKLLSGFTGMALFFTIILWGSAGSVFAYEVQIHGYGYQDFVKTNRNEFMGAREGMWDNVSMSLLFTAPVTDNTTVWAKIFSFEENVSMEWVYVDQKLAENLDARVGQMKMPLGIFNLVRDNKFVQLSETIPSMYSEFVDVVFETFRGVEFEYGERLNLNIFGGAPEQEEEEAEASQQVDTAAGTVTTFTHELAVKNLSGARLAWKTPFDGLTLLVSGCMFHEQVDTIGTTIDVLTPAVTQTEETSEGREKLWVASVDYSNHGIDLKAEYARKKGADEKIISYYGQLGYTLFDVLTPYARFDYITTNIYEKSVPSNYQKDWTAGISYKINEYLKVKAEGHYIKGFALPIATEEEEAESGHLRWKMYVAGVNFMF